MGLRFDGDLSGQSGLHSPKDAKLALKLLVGDPARGLPAEVDSTLPFVVLPLLDAAEFDLEISFGVDVMTEAL